MSYIISLFQYKLSYLNDLSIRFRIQILQQQINKRSKKIQRKSRTENMKKRFAEQFQESEANMSEVDRQQSYSQNAPEDGEAIQLVKIKPGSGLIQLNQNALDLIAECDLPVGFVVLVGKYRTGKSCLLNRMLGLQGKGFKVDSTTNACTQGIWMWSKPFFNSNNQSYLFFLDTEGTESLVKDTQNDIKIFTLSCLLSSYLIFNTVGNIDQRSIQQLNLVTKLSHNILIADDVSNKDNQQNLYRFMPKFMWLLRDFTLELRDEKGRSITSNQYLQNSLKDQDSLMKVNQQNRRVKRSIQNVFRHRDCFTLVRPAKQQSELQKLSYLPDHVLRRQFIDGINKLKQIVFKNSQAKIYEGEALFGGSVVSMLQNFVKSINSGGIPNIKTAWDQIAEDEGVFAYNRALQCYNQIYSQKFTQDEPIQPEQLHEILEYLRDQTLLEFSHNITNPNDVYLSKLKQYLKDKQKNIIQVNKQLNQFKNVQILKDLSQDIMRRIQNGGYKGKGKVLTQDINEVVKKYNKTAKGQAKGQIITQFLTTLNPIILSLEEPKQKQPQPDYIKEQYQKKMKAMQKQMASLKSQLQSKQSVNVLKNVSNQPIKKPQKLPQKGNSKIQKKKNTGCCGGSCQIM